MAQKMITSPKLTSLWSQNGLPMPAQRSFREVPSHRPGLPGSATPALGGHGAHGAHGLSMAGAARRRGQFWQLGTQQDDRRWFHTVSQRLFLHHWRTIRYDMTTKKHDLTVFFVYFLILISAGEGISKVCYEERKVETTTIRKYSHGMFPK